MKNFIPLLLVVIVTVFSCSSSDNSNPPEQSSEFAMTAKLIDILFETNNPFGTNEFSNSNY